MKNIGMDVMWASVSSLAKSTGTPLTITPEALWEATPGIIRDSWNAVASVALDAAALENDKAAEFEEVDAETVGFDVANHAMAVLKTVAENIRKLKPEAT